MYLISAAFQGEYEVGFANGLVRNGVPVTVVGANRSLTGRLDPEVRFLNLRRDQDPRRSTVEKSLNMLRYFAALSRTAPGDRGAIFHTNGLFALRHGWGVVFEALWCRLIFREWWLTVHNLLPRDEDSAVNRRVFRLAYRLPDRLFVHTDATAAALCEEFAVPRERVHVVEHGIDRFVEPDAEGKAWIRRRLSLPEFGILVLFFGRVSRYKGVDLLLEAVERATLPPDALVLIAGRGTSAAYTAELRARMALLRTADRVVWRDEYLADEDVPHLLAAADCVVLPYRDIDQSGVLFAAKSAGLPVIVSDVGSFRAYAEPGRDVVVPPADVEALAAALARAARAAPSGERAARVEAARRRYAWRETLRPYAELVRSASRRRPRSVLMLVENLSVPTDPRVWSEARTLREYGYEVSVICPKGEGRDRAAREVLDGVHIYRYAGAAAAGGWIGYLKEYAVAGLATLRLSLTVWRRHGIDAIHAANPPDTFFLLALLYKAFGTRYVFDQHDLAPELFSVRFRGRMGPLYRPLYRVLQLLEACSCRVADAVITSNESQRAAAIGRGRCRPERVFVVRSGPDLRGFHPVAPEPALKRGRRYLLAYLGVMGVQDGVEYALQALHELVVRRGRRDVSLALIGDGDQLEHLKTLARGLGLDDHVTFTGWLDRKDLLRYLTVTDVGIVPDPSNELNDRSTLVKTMEYMAMGKPLVAFDTAETRYSAGEAALYAPPNLVAGFADRIETLLQDERLRLAMGACGRRRIEQELCWDRTKVGLRRVYDTLFPPDPVTAARRRPEGHRR